MRVFSSAEEDIIAQKLIDFLIKEETLTDDEVEDCVDFLKYIKNKEVKRHIEDAYNLIIDLQTAAESKDYAALEQTLTAEDVQEWLDAAYDYCKV